MRIERLFNVLVLGGAALSGACSDAKEQDEDADGLSRGDGGAASGAGGTDASGGATETVAAGGAAASGGTGSGGDGAGGGAGGGATGPECSPDGNASDPCGCPCCWVSDDCTNDEPCCAVFCASGNHGEGCCPP